MVIANKIYLSSFAIKILSYWAAIEVMNMLKKMVCEVWPTVPEKLIRFMDSNFKFLCGIKVFLVQHNKTFLTSATYISQHIFLLCVILNIFGPAKWRVTTSEELRFMTPFMKSQRNAPTKHWAFSEKVHK